METFGEFIRERRINQGLSLRQFCQMHNEDPSNWSKLERGILRPPSDGLRINMIGRYLSIAENHDEMDLLFNLADIGRGVIPPDILNDKELCKKLPMLFCLLRKDELSGLMKVAEIVKEAHSSNDTEESCTK